LATATTSRRSSASDGKPPTDPPAGTFNGGMSGLPFAAAVPATLPHSAAERLAVLFDGHHERLYRLARRLGPTADDALDLIQETVVKAARAPGAIPSGFAGEEAWLVRVLVNVRRDQWRLAAVRRRYRDEMRPSLVTGTVPEAALVPVPPCGPHS